MITSSLQAEIESQLKRKINTIAPLSAANNAHIYRLGMEGGISVVAKVAERGLDIEAFMLNTLREKSQLPVPKIYYHNAHVIIMEFIETHYSADDRALRNAAELLAALHGIHGEAYGFDRDTLIGSLRQPNPQSRDWAGFFAEHRLLYMAGEALKENKIDAKLMKQIEKLAAKLPQYIKTPAQPSLIHGDVWSGNVLFGQGRVLAFLDPAIYYADPEIELAFIRYFGSLGDSFFLRYNDLRPIAPGFEEERAPLYSLYPLLVHTRLFGTSYARKAQRIIEKFV